MNPSKNVIALQKSQEVRLDEIFLSFARAEPQYLRFQEFLHLVIDRAMLSNKHTLTLFLEYFNKAIEPDIVESPEINAKMEKKMSKQKFTYFITLIAKIMFPADRTPIDTIFKTILIDKPLVNMKDAIEPPKVLAHDELNRRVMTEQIIQVMCEYDRELQRVYALYNSDNLRYGKLMLSWREISIQNKKMSSFGLIKLLKESDVIPALISPEHIGDIIAKIVPPITIREHNFFHTNIFSQIYDKDMSVNDEAKFEGDPHYYYHEFQLLLARLGIESGGKGPEKKDDEKLVRHFLGQTLLLRSNKELDENKELPPINKAFLKRLAASYKEGKGKRKEGEEEIKGEININLEGEAYEEVIFDQEPLPLDLVDVFKKLDKELPKIPDELKIIPQNPPPFEKEPLQIGPTVPKPKEKGMQRKPPPKPPKKKDKDEKIILWEGMPQPREQLAPENVLDFRHGLEDKDQQDHIDSGTMSDIEVAPMLIKEILYPPEMPIEVATYLEAAIVNHNQSNFTLALKNYERAKNEWSKGSDDLPEEILLFFEYSKGLVYESAGRDDYALTQYIGCRQFAEKIAFNNPDRALPYAGLGSILYKTFDYYWALRSFLKSLEIREKILGPESVDTATIYNNVGCCMYFLDRIQEAHSYFEIAVAVFDLILGPFHYRTMTVKQLAKSNMAKSKKLSHHTVAPCLGLWKTLQFNKFPQHKKKKKKKAKKD